MKVVVDVVDAVSGQSGELRSGSSPRPPPSFRATGSSSDPPPERSGWGVPLGREGRRRRSSRWSRAGADPDDGGADLNDGPQGYQFARVFRSGDQPGFFVATTESRIDQLKALLKGYEPNLRAGEFVFAPDAPAIGVSPTQAENYLAVLGEVEGLGLRYRLPTREEWLRFARAGRATKFWWGDDPNDGAARQGANFKGAEKPVEGARREDELDVIRPTPNGGASMGGFRPNPWGLWHTFGNVAEWASDSSGDGFWMMGGNFRTERDPANFRAEDLEVKVKKGEPPPQPFVGPRVVAEITPRGGKGRRSSRVLRKPAPIRREAAFAAVARGECVRSSDSATATVTGRVPNIGHVACCVNMSCCGRFEVGREGVSNQLAVRRRCDLRRSGGRDRAGEAIGGQGQLRGADLSLRGKRCISSRSGRPIRVPPAGGRFGLLDQRSIGAGQRGSHIRHAAQRAQGRRSRAEVEKSRSRRPAWRRVDWRSPLPLQSRSVWARNRPRRRMTRRSYPTSPN